MYLNISKICKDIPRYTQYQPGRHFHIDHLKAVIDKLRITFPHSKIGFPMIGCGIGGGHWPNVRRQLKKLASNQRGIKVTVVNYTGQKQ